ncbi:MAG: alpha-L-fucosidase [Flavobacteriaceae bacterium]|jgi:alpha-L-fucosidase|nr:alpha-L-fucosidase [Flavobacteriaceae bacterium]NVJ71895.1 alpha-L-fucosidase [Flavobacteriaceae bacterium]
MNNYLKIVVGVILPALLIGCNSQEIKNSLPVPSPRQLNWQDLEYYAFVHFSINSFTDKEWGYGDESPKLFNPFELDTDQWARTISEAGMKGVVITAKHHDGFCLWPSKYTEHSVKNSPWKNGEGDLLKELSESSKKYGLKMGVYLSPWDRNHPDYGTDAYLTYYRNQLRELLTQYGPIFEVWFDGANGGDGYYGGANETRKIDNKTYYDWPLTHQIVRELQPNAVMFSDAGPDIRWVGNEKGYANQTTWSTIYKDSIYPGMPGFNRFAPGQEKGTHFIPTETDVSIRPGWFYHQSEDDEVKSVEHLWDIYCNSVGLNSNLLLNLPVDRRGLVHENDIASLQGLKSKIERVFETNLATMAQLKMESSSNVMDSSILTDGQRESFVKITDKDSKIILEFDATKSSNLFVIQEAIQKGQRIRSFEIEALIDASWQVIYQGTTIGNKRIVRFPTSNIKAIALKLTDFNDKALISEMGLYYDSDVN